MSNYQSKALNPRNGTVEVVSMLDDYYSKHQYAVAFQDGSKYPENQVVCIHPNDNDVNSLLIHMFYQGFSAKVASWRNTEDNVTEFFGWPETQTKEYRKYSFVGNSLNEACGLFRDSVDKIRRNK